MLHHDFSKLYAAKLLTLVRYEREQREQSQNEHAAVSNLQVKYILGVSYQKQDTLQGELGNLIKQLQLGNFKWQEFVMGMAMLGFLISLKLIQKK